MEPVIQRAHAGRNHEYTELHNRLTSLMSEVYAAIHPPAQLYTIQWNILETVLYDEDCESVADSYPVLLVDIRVVHTNTLWNKKIFPYTICIERYQITIRETQDPHTVVRNELGGPFLIPLIVQHLKITK